MVDQKLSDAVDTHTILFNVDGMTCATCAIRIERVFDRQDDVEAASVNLAGATALVRVGPNTDPAALAAAVEKIGYKLDLGHFRRRTGVLRDRRNDCQPHHSRACF